MASNPEEQEQMVTRLAARRLEAAGSSQTPIFPASNDSTLLPRLTNESETSPSRSNTPAAASVSISQGTARGESVHRARGRIPIPDDWIEINPEYWGKWAYRDSDQPNGEQIDAALVYIMEMYARKGLEGQPLFYRIVDDLGDWRDEWFASANPSIVKEVNRFLHCRGVLPAQTAHRRAHETLAATVAAQDFTPWDQDQIDRAVSKYDEFCGRVSKPEFLLKITNGAISATSTTPERRIILEVRQTTIPPISVTSRTTLPMRSLAPTNQQSVRSTAQSHHNYPAARELWEESDPTVVSIRQYKDLRKTFPKEKMYSGGKYEVLQETLTMFYDYCEKVGIREQQYHSVINIVLTGKAAEYYYTAVRTIDETDFLSVVDTIRNRFETHGRRLELLSELRALSFGSVARSMEGKSRLEILEELIDRIDKLAKTLPYEGTNERKVDHLCIAVQRVPEARIPLQQSHEDYETLCWRLRSSLIIEARMPHQANFQSHDGPHQQHWVDRTYNGKGKEARYGNRQGGGTDPSPGRRSNPRPEQKGNGFICKKDGSWSSNHSEEERTKSYEQYRKSRGTQGKTSPDRFNQFLVAYEGQPTGGTDHTVDDPECGLGRSESEEDLTPYTKDLDYDEFDDINHSFFVSSA
ncbi:hypothetical protein CORC01_08441 [Colletotrichum orchidophilum]|uniref:Uncharacterized protein n=1 Tax=Colletotrichum orchidophilum TaxID=1209926 RepID=A0A1G4B4H6_9PEZI|nr:uncharacterized protein CORC01_08441 [Colletotrichum orchidophilum]OHE96223.1 hypothetical protein CORC01_08441 [Colletotrichum orchidophilum]